MAQDRRRSTPTPIPDAPTLASLDVAVVAAVTSWDGNASTYASIRAALGVRHGESEDLSAAVSRAWRAMRRRVLLADA